MKQNISPAEQRHSLSTLEEVFDYNKVLKYRHLGNVTTMTPGLLIAEYEVKYDNITAPFSIRIEVERYQNEDMIASLPIYKMKFAEVAYSPVNNSRHRSQIEADIKEAAAKTNRDH